MVIRGDVKKEGINYNETFSLAIIKYFLAIALKDNWALFQLDVNDVILYGSLFEEAYIKFLSGVTPHSSNPVRLLKKSIYGLKQAFRQWYAKLNSTLTFGSYPIRYLLGKLNYLTHMKPDF